MSITFRDGILSENLIADLQDLRALADQLANHNMTSTANLPFLVDNLRRADLDNHQYWAVRALWFLAFGTREGSEEGIVQVYREYRVVPEFMKLLESSSPAYVKAEVLATFGLLGLCSRRYRDFLLDEGVLSYILAFFHPKVQFSLSEIAMRALLDIVNSAAGSPPFEKIRSALPYLKEFLYIEEDIGILKIACTITTYICDETEEWSILAIIEGGIYSRLVDLLFHSSPSILELALKVIAKVVSVANYEQSISKPIFLSRLLFIISSENMEAEMTAVRSYACRTISNMVVRHKDNIEAVIDAGLIPPLVSLLASTEHGFVKAEGGLALSNIVSGGTVDQIEYLVEHGGINVLYDIMSPSDTSLTKACLIGLESMFKVAMDSEDKDKYLGLFRDQGRATLDKFFNLPTDLEDESYERLQDILHMYFGL